MVDVTKVSETKYTMWVAGREVAVVEYAGHPFDQWEVYRMEEGEKTDEVGTYDSGEEAVGAAVVDAMKQGGW